LELHRGRQGRRVKTGRSLTKWPTAHRTAADFCNNICYKTTSTLLTHLVGGNFEDEDDELELLEPGCFGRMMSFGSFDVCIAGVQP
jgi:hypothetical protein